MPEMKTETLEELRKRWASVLEYDWAALYGLMVGKRDPRIWLVWVQTTSGSLDLAAVCSTQERAEIARKHMKDKAQIIRAWTEETVVNHIYGESALGRR